LMRRPRAGRFWAAMAVQGRAAMAARRLGHPASTSQAEPLLADGGSPGARRQASAGAVPDQTNGACEDPELTRPKYDGRAGPRLQISRSEANGPAFSTVVDSSGHICDQLRIWI
jgi:hypothetical protein